MRGTGRRRAAEKERRPKDTMGEEGGGMQREGMASAAFWVAVIEHLISRHLAECHWTAPGVNKLGEHFGETDLDTKFKASWKGFMLNLFFKMDLPRVYKQTQSVCSVSEQQRTIPQFQVNNFPPRPASLLRTLL